MSISAVAAVARDLRESLKRVEGLRVVEDPASAPAPPLAVVGNPSLRWESYSPHPSSATFTVYVVVRVDPRSLEVLLALLPQVAEAVDYVTDAVVTTAQPGTFSAGGSDLPCYELTVTVGLSE